jgi:hypothetical protein
MASWRKRPDRDGTGYRVHIEHRLSEQPLPCSARDQNTRDHKLARLRQGPLMNRSLMPRPDRGGAARVQAPTEAGAVLMFNTGPGHGEDVGSRGATRCIK